MSLKAIKRININAALGIFATAVVISVMGLYVVFDFYVSSVGEELIGSWLQTEAVAIQEGYLLSSITKSQRMLLSSQFVKGVTLFDVSEGFPKSLIEVGSPVEFQQPHQKSSDSLDFVAHGFFHKRVLYQIPDRKDLVLVFDVESLLLQKLFFLSAGILFLLIGLLFAAIKLVERREAYRRENFLKKTLNEFVDRDRPSEFIEFELPFLVQWWREKKAENDRAKQLAVASESKILLGELAARVAHDIRSPLNTLTAVISNLSEVPDENKKMLKDSTQRIRDIANGIADQNRKVISSTRILSASRPSIDQASPTLLSVVVEELISEKRLQYRDMSANIESEISQASYRAFVLVNVLEIRRTLSNLIDNAVESLGPTGRVVVEVRSDEENFNVRISDNGRGMPAHVIARLGEKNFTHGKRKGSGLGVHYAKRTVEQLGGEICFDSRAGGGTNVAVSLPLMQAPAWFAKELSFAKGSTVIIVDDDSTVHAMCREILKDVEQDLDILHFFEPKPAVSWYVKNKGRVNNYYLISDYDLRDADTDGLDLIDHMSDQRKNAVLVTSAFEDQIVQGRCLKMGIQILPKPALAVTPVELT
jgi:signal transduction histidine kinase